jgi:hypothetical protein
MKARSTILVCAATMLGFFLGALCTRQTAVRAQSEMQVKEQSGVQFYVLKRDVSDMDKKEPTVIPGKAIVGFSCVLGKNQVTVDCYTAFVK